MSFLGIDLGTSGWRALLVDRSGRAIATAERNYETQHPHAGWSEQDPRKWTQALEAVVEELAATQSTFADLSGVAVSGHMHGAVLIDDQGTLIRLHPLERHTQPCRSRAFGCSATSPCIVWKYRLPRFYCAQTRMVANT